MNPCFENLGPKTQAYGQNVSLPSTCYVPPEDSIKHLLLRNYCFLDIKAMALENIPWNISMALISQGCEGFIFGRGSRTGV